MPLPSEETTPPVTNTNRVMIVTADKVRSRALSQRECKRSQREEGNSTGIQVSRTCGLRQSTLDNNRAHPPIRCQAPARRGAAHQRASSHKSATAIKASPRKISGNASRIHGSTPRD